MSGINPVFTPEFKMGYDSGKEHQKHNAEVRARKEIGLHLSNLLMSVDKIEGVGPVMAKRIQQHFGGGSNET